MAWALSAPVGDALPNSNPAPAAADPARLAAAAAALLRSFERLSRLQGVPHPAQTAAAPSPGATEREPGDLPEPAAAAAAGRAPGAGPPQVVRDAAGQGVPPATHTLTEPVSSSVPGAAGGGAPEERAGAALEDMREAHLACLAWLRALLQRRRHADAAEQVQAALLAALLSAPQARTLLQCPFARRL